MSRTVPKCIFHTGSLYSGLKFCLDVESVKLCILLFSYSAALIQPCVDRLNNVLICDILVMLGILVSFFLFGFCYF